METKVEKIIEDFSMECAKALKNGEEVPSDLKLQIEAELIKAASQDSEKILEKDKVIRQQLNEIADLRLMVSLQKSLLEHAKRELDKFNLTVEGWDRYVFEKNEQLLFNALPAYFDLDELHFIGESKFGLSESSRLGMIDFFLRFYLISEHKNGFYRKLLDRVPTDLNEIAHIKNRVTLPLSD
ncbi:hypothetical protein [Roseivirga thermotolerans]|uniref:hypothetical protein n=1 Tax=Roseivirga thermotolerans TaxID=1758176 RepID=UPI00273CF53F|nr:hypothetical protein [Roseivirga thermotolerans]